MSRKIGMWLYSNSGGDKIQGRSLRNLKREISRQLRHQPSTCCGEEWSYRS